MAIICLSKEYFTSRKEQIILKELHVALYCAETIYMYKIVESSVKLDMYSIENSVDRIY